MTLEELYQNPEFQKAPYSVQQGVLNKFWTEEWSKRSDVQALSLEQQQQVWKNIVYGAPAYEGIGRVDITQEEYQTFEENPQVLFDSDPLGDYKYAEYIRRKILAGDPKGQELFKQFTVQSKVANESLIANIVMAGADTLRQIFDGDDKPSIARKARDLTKAVQYLQTVVSPVKAREAVDTASNLSFAVGFVENAAITSLLAGAPEAAGLFASGANTLGQQSAGLLTRGIYKSLGELAKTTASPTARTLLLKGAPFAVDAMMGGVVDVVRTFPAAVTQDNLNSPELWKNLSRSFGEGVVNDVLWGAGRAAVKQVFKPFVQTFKNLNLNDSDSVRRTLQAIDAIGDEKKFKNLLNTFVTGKISSEVVGHMDNADEILRKARRFMTIQKREYIDPTSLDGAKMLASIADLDIEFEGGKYLVKDGDLILFEGPKLSDSVGYLQSFLRETDPVKAVSDDLKRMLFGRTVGQFGGQTDMRIKVGVKTQIDLTSPKNVELRSKIGAPVIYEFLKEDAEGFIDTKRVVDGLRLLAYSSGLKALDADKYLPFIKILGSVNDVATAVERGGVTSPTLYIPKRITSEAERRSYIELLSKQLNLDYLKMKNWHFGDMPSSDYSQAMKNQSKVLDTIVKKYTPPLSLNPAALTVAYGKLGANLSMDVNGYHVQFPDGTKAVFKNSFEANNFLGKVLASSQQLDFDSYKSMLYQNTRLILSKEVDPVTKVTQVFARDPFGNIVGKADSLEQLIASDPIFLPKLPESLAPQTFLTSVKRKDVEGLKIEFHSDVAVATPERLRDMMNSFASNKEFLGGKATKNIIDIDDNGFIFAETPTRKIEFTAPDLGMRKTFKSYAEAKAFANKAVTDFHTLESELVSKGHYITTMNGKVEVVTSDGKFIQVKSIDDIKNILKGSPDPEWAPSVVPSLDPDIEDTLIDKVQDALKNEDLDAHLQAKPNKTVLFDIGTKTGAYWRPMYSTIHRIATKTGVTELRDVANQLITGNRLVASQSLHAVSLLEGILSEADGKPISRAKLKMFQHLLNISESNRDMVAKSVFNMELTKYDKKVLNRVQQYLQAYGTRFGIDAVGFITDYAPRVRAHISELQKDPEALRAFNAKSKAAQLQEIFKNDAQAIRTMEFMSRHSRLDMFLTPGYTDDILQSARTYVLQGIRNEFLGPALQKAKEFSKKIPTIDSISPSEAAVIQKFLTEFAHMDTSPAEELASELSLKASKKIADGIRKLKNLIPGENFANFIDDWADSTITPRGLEKIQSMTTFATLGARPIRGLTNIMQYNNTRAIFDEYADTAVALSQAVFKSGDKKALSSVMATIHRLQNKGLISEHMVSVGIDTPEGIRKVLDMSMRNQQGSELLTRAWTAMAAELAFDDGLQKLGKGIVDWDGFVKIARLSILPDDQIAQIQKYLKMGKPELGRDLFSAEATRILMGEYNSSNAPLMFRGVVGKLFGKFGVFPVNQIDLYNTILARGTASERILRAVKLIALSQATYEAFRLVGLDYSGFKFTDPFAFAGGPLYTTLNDTLQAMRGGPAGQLAQRRLQNSWRLVIPFSFEAQSLMRAMTAASEGEYQKALIEALSGTYTPTNIFVRN